MAETLEEIYNNSINATDLVNGEATIFTTDANTRYVIKAIQVNENETEDVFKVGGTISVNNFDLVAATGNSAGSEIIGPNSTIKLSSDFTLTYTDAKLETQTSAYATRSFISPAVNGITGKAASETVNASFSSNSYTSQDMAFRQTWANVGPSNQYVVYLQHDTNSSTQVYIINASNGSVVNSNTASYQHPYYDGGNRVFWVQYHGYFGYIDLNNTASKVLKSVTGSTTSASTYSKCFGVPGDIVFGWGEYATSAAPLIYWDLVNDTVGTLTSGAGLNGIFTAADNPWFAYKVSDRNYKIMSTTSNSNLKIYDINLDTVYSSTQTATNVSLTNGMSSANESKAIVGNRFYYRGNSTSEYYYYDFSDGTQGVIPASLVNYNGNDMWGTFLTPDSATVAGRTYDVNPAISMRITGVKSV